MFYSSWYSVQYWHSCYDYVKQYSRRNSVSTSNGIRFDNYFIASRVLIWVSVIILAENCKLMAQEWNENPPTYVREEKIN